MSKRGKQAQDVIEAVLSADSPAQEVAGRLAEGAEKLVERSERVADTLSPPRERELMRRALDLSTRKKLLLARRLWKDPRVQRVSRLPMVAGTVYMMLPIRLLPVRFGPLRNWEKLIGLAAILWLIVRITPEDVLREHLDAVDRPGPIRRLFKRDE